ncbi:MAG TPA: serine hydrolase [Flavilitoribacter sp.]|nr:serine hydrolase [Flavilitoribacter sp.]HMQ90619.1 serine hydrolase [Flavilitoribacter sp.]
MLTRLPFCLLAVLCALGSRAQNLYFPPLTGTVWSTVTPAELGWQEAALAETLQWLDEKNTKAFIILQDGKIAVEYYFDNFTRDSLWYWASAGKSLTGVMVGLAQEDGLLTLDDTSSDYLGVGWTQCPPDKEALIKVRHHITMTTGLDDSLESPGSANSCFDPECFQYKADAGTRWAYHNSPYRITQDILETVSGLNFTLYTRQRLGNRIGMGGLWYNHIYISTARDMARFGLLMLNKGRWAADQVMQDTAYFNAMTNTSQNLNKSYGYLWWLNGKSSFMLPGLQYVFDGWLIPEAPGDLFAAMGKNEQRIYVIPSRNMVIVRTGESAFDGAPAASIFDNQLWERLNQVFTLTATSEPVTDIRLKAWPNPGQNSINLEAGSRIERVQVFGTAGRQLLEQAGNGAFALQLDTSDWMPGVYWLEVTTDKRRQVIRWVKI